MINTISKSCETLKLNGILSGYQAIADECIKGLLKTGFINKLEISK
jgi:hypothetical protein